MGETVSVESGRETAESGRKTATDEVLVQDWPKVPPEAIHMIRENLTHTQIVQLRRQGFEVAAVYCVHCHKEVFLIHFIGSVTRQAEAPCVKLFERLGT